MIDFNQYAAKRFLAGYVSLALDELDKGQTVYYADMKRLLGGKYEAYDKEHRADLSFPVSEKAKEWDKKRGDPARLPIRWSHATSRAVAIKAGRDNVGLRIAAAIGTAFHMFRRAFETLQVGDRIALMAALDIEARHGVVLRLEGPFPHGPLAIDAAAVLSIIGVDAFFREGSCVSMPQRCMPRPKGKLE